MLSRNTLMVLLILVILAGAGIWLSTESFVDATASTITLSASDFYDYMRPQIVKAVQDSLNAKPAAPTAVASGPALQPNQMPSPMPAAFGQYSQNMNSPAMRQGDDYSGCKPFNKDEYIRKDSIPCYGCSIPAPY
jgi:hypothetical protein